MDCIFCRIVAGEIPSTKVVESEHAFAFRDLHPVAPTHVLVIPKLHIASAAQVTAEHGESLAAVLLVAQEVARIDAIEDSGYRLVWNVGEAAGMTVAHLHLHVLGGRTMSWPPFR